MAVFQQQSHNRSFKLKAVAIAALIFGLMTLFSGGAVLFGPEYARLQAGNIVPIVLWFNFTAGLLYVAAALGIWFGRNWALGLSILITIATGIVALIFFGKVIYGVSFEARTAIALVFRIGFWAAISAALYVEKKDR